MHNRFRRTGALIGTGAPLFGGLAVIAGNQADAQLTPPSDHVLGRPGPDQQLLDQPLQGKAVLSKHQQRLAAFAARNGLAEKKLQHILSTDKASWLDRNGRLFYREPVATAAEKAAARPAPRSARTAVAAATGPAFQLHSRAGSNRVI